MLGPHKQVLISLSRMSPFASCCCGCWGPKVMWCWWGHLVLQLCQGLCVLRRHGWGALVLYSGDSKVQAGVLAVLGLLAWHRSPVCGVQKVACAGYAPCLPPVLGQCAAGVDWTVKAVAQGNFASALTCVDV